jgi:hypothetical protein
MLKGDMTLEYLEDGRRRTVVIREREMLLVLALRGGHRDGLRRAIEQFDSSPALRACQICGHVQPERAPVPERP